MNRKPRLVDPSWFTKPKSPKPKIIIKKPIIEPNTNNSMMINLIGLLILGVGALCIYQRYIEKDDKELEKQNTIIGFHQYVKENIK
jgi:hypothetical protein